MKPSTGSGMMSRAMPRIGSWRRAILPSLLAEGLIVAALVGWWLLAQQLPPYVFPSIGAVLNSLVGLLFDPNFAVHTLSSGLRVLTSIVLALMIGFVLAVLPTYLPAASGIVHDRITPILNSFPSVGWAVLAAIWFGISEANVVFVQTMILIPFCLVNISEGVRSFDRELYEMGRSFSRKSLRIVTLIQLPALVPYALSALRMAYGVAWKVALVAELFGADSGLGYLMLRAQTNADPALLFATCFMVVIFFFLGERLVLNPLVRRFSWAEREARVL